MFDILSCQLVTRAAAIFSVQTDTPPLSTINKVNQIQVQASFTFIDHSSIAFVHFLYTSIIKTANFETQKQKKEEHILLYIIYFYATFIVSVLIVLISIHIPYLLK